MKCKKNPKRKFFFKMYFLLTIILTLHLPSNYSGQVLRLNRSIPVSNIAEAIVSNDLNSRMSSGVSGSFIDSSAAVNHGTVTTEVVVIYTMVLIASSVLLLLFYGHSNTVAPIQRCLLLDLLQEAIRSFFFINLAGYAAVIVCFMGSDQSTIDTTWALLISYCYSVLTLHLLITLNVMALLKMRMSKELLLDPQLFWSDRFNNDSIVFTWFRLASMAGSLLFVSPLYYFQICTKLYYMLIDNDDSPSREPPGTAIFTWTLIMLHITYVINCIRYYYYKHRGVSEVTSSPKVVHPLALLLGVAFGLIIVIGEFFDIFEAGKIWTMILLYQILATIIVPSYIMIATPKLAAYARKTLKCWIMVFVNILLACKSSLRFSMFNKRSSRIEPIT